MNFPNPESIYNIIFDLGGVLIDIDVKGVLKAFSDAGVTDIEKMTKGLSESKIYKRFEVGLISKEEFFDEIRGKAELNLSNSEIEKAWNMMLHEFPLRRVELVQQLAKNYNIFLLSNTNIIHYDYFTSQFVSKYGFEIEKLFVQAYFSFLIGLHKPETAVFDYVLSESKLVPGETLFIDDTPANCDAASECGILSYFKPPEIELTDLFRNGGLKSLITAYN
jgi:glucose-1-phosphatase